MDLNEYTKIQCFNCHNDILSPSLHSPDIHEINAVCEECINIESNQITAMKTQTEIMQRQLFAFKNNFKEELQHFCSRDKESDYTLEQLELKLKQLQSEALEISLKEGEVDEQLSTLMDEYNKICDEVDQQSRLLQDYDVCFEKLVEKQMTLQSELKGLSLKSEQLQKISILNELYHIHFDDNGAFINLQPVTYASSKLILQILCLLIDKYHYKGFTVNFCDSYIRTDKETISIKTESQSTTLPWISFIAKETLSIWEHIKQQASILTHQNYSSFALPFNIELFPKVSIYGVILAEGVNYRMFLKYFTHNLKLMINFDLNVDMTVASRLKGQN